MGVPDRHGKIVSIGLNVEEVGPDPDQHDEEEEPQQDDDAVTIQDFLSWSRPRWAMLQDLFPVVRQGNHDAVQSRGSISAEQWVKMITALGFPGDAWRIYEIISYDHQAGTCSVSIVLRQLLQFRRNYGSEDADEDLVQEFLGLLRKKHKVIVQAWRLELDKHNRGQICFKELQTACNRIGFKPASNVRRLWSILRGTPENDLDGLLGLKDLDQIEALNMEAFARIVWDELGSLENAWERIDPYHTNMVALQDFVWACKDLKFKGHVKTLFHGLAVSGGGRLVRQDIDFLKHWSPAETLKKLNDDELATHFFSWVDYHFQGAEGFFIAVDDGKKGFLSPQEFILAAQSHGYTGTQQQLQRLFAFILKAECDPMVAGAGIMSANSLINFRNPKCTTVNVPKARKRKGSNASSSSSIVDETRQMFVQMVETVGWRDILELVDGDAGGLPVHKFISEVRKLALRCGIEFDNVDLNALVPMLGRSGSDESWVSKRDVLLLRKRLNPTPLVDYTPPSSTTEATQAMLDERPGWNEAVGTVAVYNDKVPAHMRKYFSTPDKPQKKDRKPIRHVPGFREDIPDQSNRPAWNDTVGSMSSINDKVPATLRNYFGEEAEKPVRDRIRRQLQKNVARNRND
eukprot:gnl/MRDRNA2_/MRDRNA2_99044_c0_seq1.p1 gnl/MRDRNA2_/MRDRNA2_99044_c0~~gnl/MRDRNA2_/MRDRNA2_99044_c0_seq1.p1  ORF type:complete len:655 (+),score=136.89 gnl/MRDRNA2_/MRDRNA2_99044_c0_seq1:74-1966(+)